MSAPHDYADKDGRAPKVGDVSAKQGSNVKPRNTPIVLLVSIVGAIAAMGIAWAYVF